MRNKLFFSTNLFFISTVSLSAQAPMAMHSNPMAGSDTIRLLEQNALLALMVAVVLIGIVWIAYVLQACAQLSKPQGGGSRSFMSLVILLVGLSAFCSSCSVSQRSLMAQHRDNMAKSAYCSCPQQYQQAIYGGLYVKNSYIPYANCQGPDFCRTCGHRILNH